MVTSIGERAVGNNSSQMITRYRPSSLEEVIGQPTTVKSIQALLNEKDLSKWPKVFLFVGPSGTGKTTLAKIIASHLGCKSGGAGGLLEINAATDGKVDDARQIVSEMEISPLSGEAKVLLMDECHRMTKESWDAFLKPTEDALPFAYYMFCTTDPRKIPKTLTTRAITYTLQPVPAGTLKQYAAEVIAPLEDMNLPEGAVDTIVDAADGSPRQLLTLLEACRPATTLHEVKELCQATMFSMEEGPVIDIARMLSKGVVDWNAYMEKASNISESDWGGFKKIMMAYFSKVVKGNPSRNNAILLEALDRLPEYPGRHDGLAALQLLLFRTVMKSHLQ